MFAKRILAIHDLCSYGRCSLTAAIPILSSMGFQVCPMPLSLHSNSIMYNSCYASDIALHSQCFMEKWEEIGCTYQAVYSGFLPNAAQMGIAAEAIGRFSGSDTLIVVDPMLSRSGAPAAELVSAMQHLIGKATVVTPNLTEACLLTGQKLERPVPSASFLASLCAKVVSLGPPYVIITAIPTVQNNTIKIVSYDACTSSYDECHLHSSLYRVYGLSDLFASVLTGALLKKYSLHSATSLALDFLSYTLSYTQKAGTDLREGVQFEPCLRQLFKI